MSSLGDVILLTNTSEGSQWSFSFKVDRPFRNGFFLSGSYLYNDATSIGDGTIEPGGVELGQRPHRLRRCQRPAADALELLGRQHGEAERDDSHPARRRPQLCLVLLQRTVRSSIRAGLQRRRERRQSLHQRHPLRADQRRSSHRSPMARSLNCRPTSRATTAPRTRRDASPNATPAARPGRTASTSGTRSRIPTGSRARVELTMDVLNLLNLFNDSDGWSLFPNFNAPSRRDRRLRQNDRQIDVQPRASELTDLRDLPARQSQVAMAGAVGPPGAVLTSSARVATARAVFRKSPGPVPWAFLVPVDRPVVTNSLVGRPAIQENTRTVPDAP